MLKRALLAVMLLAGLVMVSAPASAYVALVLCPDGFTYNGSNAPEITVSVGETFALQWVIASDDTFVTSGVDITLGFDPALETANGAVDDSSTDFAWNGFMSTNTYNNTTGVVTYQKSMNIGQSLTLGAGQYLLGWIEFTCEDAGTETKTVHGTLIPAGMGNLLTAYVGCEVNQVSAVIPEPATLLLLGSGLVFGGFAYRRRR